MEELPNYTLLKEKNRVASTIFQNIMQSKDLTKLKDMCSIIETNCTFNFEFLNALKNSNKEDLYSTFFPKIKYTLKDDQITKLNEANENLFKKLVEIVSKIINNSFIPEDYKEMQNMQKLKYPYIYSIEKARISLYIFYILNGKHKTALNFLSNYVQVMAEDLKDIKLNEEDLNEKLYLFILHATYFKNPLRMIEKTFMKGTKYEKHISISNERIIQSQNDTYIIDNILEKREINKSEYNIDGIVRDIMHAALYPLDIILLRNESLSKYMTEGFFLKRYNLYDSFKNYLKNFILSNCVREALQSDTHYKQIIDLISNPNYLDEILDEKHFRFLPFYYCERYCGVTNKDILLTVINSIPRLTEFSLDIEASKDEYEELMGFLLLFSISIIFITCLHEVIIHLTYGYIMYYSNFEISSYSPKSNNYVDGGFYFEDLLGGKEGLKYINIQKIITLLNGKSCHKSLSEFQDDLNKTPDIEEVKESKNNADGFLKDYYKVFNINYNKIRRKIIENMSISGRKGSNIAEMSITRDIPLKSTSIGGNDNKSQDL